MFPHRVGTKLSLSESCPSSSHASFKKKKKKGDGSWNSPFISYAVYRTSNCTGISILICQVYFVYFLFLFFSFLNHLLRGPIPEEGRSLKKYSFVQGPFSMPNFKAITLWHWPFEQAVVAIFAHCWGGVCFANFFWKTFSAFHVVGVNWRVSQNLPNFW